MSHYFPSVKPSQPSTRLGRPKHSRNKAPEAVRWGLVEAYRQLGGVTGLVEWARQDGNLGEFYKLLVRVLPSELAEAGLGQDNKIQVLILPPDHATRQVQPVVSITEAEQRTEKPLEEQAGGLCRQDGVAFREPKA